MKIFLGKAIFINRAPFEKLELNFSENEISILNGVNGKGKTTIISHIVDCFYEFAKKSFPNEFEGKQNKFYRVSSPIYNLNQNTPSFVYLRFIIDNSGSFENLDYLDIRNNCTEEEYNNSILLDNKILFSVFSSKLEKQKNIKIHSNNIDSDKLQILFEKNIFTYFPAYRYEQPGYINDPYKIKLNFKKDSGFSGYLQNPIEVATGLNDIANWIMDIVLDLWRTSSSTIIKNNIDDIISMILESKGLGKLNIDVGDRNLGGTRLQIGKYISIPSGQQIWQSLYPTIFNLSSGEASLLCLFGEILRQGDNIKNNIELEEISGIVLIDEVDKHLHIKLQKEILPKLLKLFPNLQFILSSHSPFLNMGLAEDEELKNKSKIKDISTGIDILPYDDEQYEEVYKMMITENDRFKENFENIKSQIENSKKLQIITEGDNTEHIEKAIQVLDNTILDKVKIIKGAENKTGKQQLKNAFEVLSNSKIENKFLFIWDCDAENLVNPLIETEKNIKFCFAKNNQNTKTSKGIENLYSDDLFSDDVYEIKTNNIDYGGVETKKIFSKQKFLDKIKLLNNESYFEKFKPLIEKIKLLIQK